MPKPKAKKKPKKPIDWSKSQTTGINWRQILEERPDLIPPGYEETIREMKERDYGRRDAVD
jgi:hypothetical protein